MFSLIAVLMQVNMVQLKVRLHLEKPLMGGLVSQSSVA